MLKKTNLHLKIFTIKKYLFLVVFIIFCTFNFTVFAQFSSNDCACEQGEKGDTGDTGDDGEQGLPGIQGEKGDVGDQGEQGIQGEQGLPGLHGDTGQQGIQGEQGLPGLHGDTGQQGIQGEQGLQGIQGDTGEQGAPGPVGERGADGIAGLQGKEGARGEIGLIGSQGDKGDSGITSSEFSQIKNIFYLNQEQNRIITLLEKKQQEGYQEQNRAIQKLQESTTLNAKEQFNTNNILDNLTESQKQSVRALFKAIKINEDQEDHIFRSTVMNEKQARDIFRMKVKDKTILRKIEKNKTINRNQDLSIKNNLSQIKSIDLSIEKIHKKSEQNQKLFQSKNITASLKLTTGALVLKTKMIFDQPVKAVDVSETGVFFLKNVSNVEGFLKGVTGQVIRILNIGAKEITLISEAKNKSQQLMLHQDEVILDKNKGLTLIFDGEYWRLLSS